jgi:Secretion system C-terminal sorting domain
MKKISTLILAALLFCITITNAQTVLSASPLACYRGDTLNLTVTASAPITNAYNMKLVLGSYSELPFSSYNTTGNNYFFQYFVRDYAPVGNYSFTNGTTITYTTSIAVLDHNRPEMFTAFTANTLSITATTSSSSGWESENGIRKILIDNAGNRYIAGTYTGASSLGSFSFANAGNRDGFIAKINANNVVKWVKTLNSTGEEGFFSIKLYNDTVLYACGFATGGSTLKYNNNNLTEYSLRNTTIRDGIVMKLDTSGTLINYAFQGSKKIDYTTDMDIDAAGNIYITGSLTGDKNNTTPNDTCATYVYSAHLADSVRLKAYSNDYNGLVLAKYNPQLKVQWAKRQDRDYFVSGAEPHCIKLTNANEIMVSAFTAGQVTWGGTLSTGSSCCNGHCLLMKTDLNGTKIWAKEMGNFSDNNEFGLDAQNNIYFPYTYAYAVDYTNLYKYNTAGNLVWQVRMSNNPDDNRRFHIVTDANGNSYITYAYNHQWATSLWNINYKKFDANGNIRAVGFPLPYTVNDNAPTAIALNPQSNKLFMSGYYKGTQTFNGLSIIGTTQKVFFLGLDVLPNTTTGIPYSEELVSDWNLYPNPTSGQFTVELQSDNATITVTDILGQQILKTQTTEKITNLQLDNNGIYIVYVTTTQGTTTRKLIVNR